MATLTNTNRVAVTTQLFEREIVWVQTDLDLTAAADLTAAIDAIEVFYSVSIIGIPTGAGCTFACHGPAAIPADLETAMDVIGAQTMTAVALSGVAFA